MVAVATLAHQRDEGCPVCDGQPRVLVVMRHPTMRATHSRAPGARVRLLGATEASADDTLDRLAPDLLIIDAEAITTGCLAALVPDGPARCTNPCLRG